MLYPNDEPEAGKQLRLDAAVLLRLLFAAGHDALATCCSGKPLDEFHEHWAAQLNDTHPSIAVAELMRLLVDEHAMDWDAAWAITQQTLRLHEPHAAGRSTRAAGRCRLFAKLLPRHLEIIYEINRRFLDDLRRRFPG